MNLTFSVIAIRLRPQGGRVCVCLLDEFMFRFFRHRSSFMSDEFTWCFSCDPELLSDLFSLCIPCSVSCGHALITCHFGYVCEYGVRQILRHRTEVLTSNCVYMLLMKTVPFLQGVFREAFLLSYYISK